MRVAPSTCVSWFAIGCVAGALGCSVSGAADEITAPDGSDAGTADSGFHADDATVTHGDEDPGVKATDAGLPKPTPESGVDAADAADAAEAATPADAAADAGATGSSCAPRDLIQSQSCGTCGFQERVCEPTTDGGASIWQPWGFCQGQPAGACAPGQATSESCGHCGTRAKVCQNDCAFAVGACTNQGACAAGEIDVQVGAPCATGTARSRTCSAQCGWGAFTACAALTNPNVLSVNGTVGATMAKVFAMPAAKIPKLVTMTACPTTLDTTSTAYSYVVVENPNPLSATVSIWSSAAAGGPTNTIMAVYDGPTPPATSAARTSCKPGTYVDEGCTSAVPTACLGQSATAPGFAGLMIDDSTPNAVTIPANHVITVYTAAWGTSTGNYRLNIRTESLQ